MLYIYIYTHTHTRARGARMRVRARVRVRLCVSVLTRIAIDNRVSPRVILTYALVVPVYAMILTKRLLVAKVTPGYEEIHMAQSMWWDYYSMTRVVKEYVVY